MKKYVIGILIGILLTLTTTVVALDLNARQTAFEPDDENWEVGTVEEALNDLYSNTGTLSLNNLTSTEIYRKTSFSGTGVITTIENVSNYKYYYVTDVYQGGSCSSDSACKNVLALTFTNASSIDLGYVYRLDNIKATSRSYFLIPTGTGDIEISISAGADGIAVYGIN